VLSNLANLIRLCRIDFGVQIRIDTGPLKATGLPDGSARHDPPHGYRSRHPADDGRLHGRL